MLEYANMKASYDALRAKYAVLAVAVTSIDKDKAEVRHFSNCSIFFVIWQK
jgi:hypothetical protein